MGFRKDYKKYYKNKQYEMMRVDDMIPCIQKKLSDVLNCVWVTFDFSTGRIKMRQVLPSMIWEDFNKEIIPWYENVFNKICHFLEYKCHISFRPNIKTLNSLKLKHIAIRAITKPDSEVYKESKYKYEMLHGLIWSKGLRQPVYVQDNVGYTGDIPHYFGAIGRYDIQKELWDPWMKPNGARSKLSHKKQRELITKDWNEKILEYIYFESIGNKKEGKK